MQSELEDKICKFIAETILFSSNGYPYAVDASFLENGIVDSMNIMEIVMFVEEQFRIKVEDNEITPDHFDSILRIARFVQGKQNPVL
jgi:acyl carrier protein